MKCPDLNKYREAMCSTQAQGIRGKEIFPEHTRLEKDRRRVYPIDVSIRKGKKK